MTAGFVLPTMSTEGASSFSKQLNSTASKASWRSRRIANTSKAVPNIGSRSRLYKRITSSSADSLPERGLTEFDGRTPNSSQFGVRPSNSPTARPSKIEFTNLDKVFWPEDGYTKGDLIDYYDKISSTIIPHLMDRPLVFERFP